MNPDTLIPLVEAADALDSNSRLLRMFELEPLIAAEPYSPEKHRALAPRVCRAGALPKRVHPFSGCR